MIGTDSGADSEAVRINGQGLRLWNLTNSSLHFPQLTLDKLCGSMKCCCTSCVNQDCSVSPPTPTPPPSSPPWLLRECLYSMTAGFPHILGLGHTWSNMVYILKKLFSSCWDPIQVSLEGPSSQPQAISPALFLQSYEPPSSSQQGLFHCGANNSTTMETQRWGTCSDPEFGWKKIILCEGQRSIINSSDRFDPSS